MATLTPSPKMQFFDANGNPLSGGKLYTYSAGTVTPLATYTDSTGGTANDNPVTLNSRGEASVWLGTSLYYMELKTSAEVLIWTADNVAGIATANSVAQMAVTIENIAALRLTAVSTNYVAITKGYYTAGDGGHGEYYGVTGAAAGTYVDNGGTIIVPTGGNGSSAWKLKHDGSFNILQFGATTTSLNNTSIFASCIAAMGTYGELIIPPGTFKGVFSIRRSNVSIIGSGSSSTTIMTPSGIDSITIELGNTALGNSATAYTNINVRGLTIDGNYTNTPAPTTDVTGQGFATTKISYSSWTDIICQNTHNAAFGTFILSNFNHVDVTVKNGGNSLISGAYYPNFDINSSSYSQYHVVSENGKYGARMLDNCFGNTLVADIYNASLIGGVYNNQTVNESYGNTITFNVINGGATAGVQIGSNVHGSTVNVNTKNVTVGFQDVGGANPTIGNTFNITTDNSLNQGCLLAGTKNIYNIKSYLDGRSGAAGTNFAIDVNGTFNTINANITDSAVAQVRGLVIRSGATNNNIVSYTHNTTVQDFLLSDTSNTTSGYPKFSTLPSLINVRVTATLSGGWSNAFGAPYSATGYSITPTGDVRLYGAMTGGAGTAFTLPANYRPVNDIIIPTVSNSGAAAAINITSAGAVSVIYGSSTAVLLDGLSFSTLM